MDKKDWSLFGWCILAFFTLSPFLPVGLLRGGCPVGEPHAHYLFSFQGSNEDYQRLSFIMMSVFVALCLLFGTLYFRAERNKQNKATQYWQSKWEHTSEDNSASLLRASAAPVEYALLRPAFEEGNTDSQQLLRADMQE